ncbi:MAG: LysM peptidoglycan-binding domain-containing protein, partial [Deltaproteobacteria bacterium]|nr:LysM peptidoglycan-binding domain-containing protein [Deltaproteobacteria bacterium]
MKRISLPLLAPLPLLALLAPLLAAPAPAQPASESQPSRTYTVTHGETLWSIAADLTGDPALWPAFYLANRDQIKHPALVYPGQRLAIPEITPATRATLQRRAAE